MTKQQGEDEKEWCLVGETCSRGGAVTVHFLKDAIKTSKEKKRRKVGETRDKKPEKNPYQLILFISVQRTQMTRLELHWLGGGHEVEGVLVESKEKPKHNQKQPGSGAFP